MSVRAVDGAVAFFNDNKEDLTRKVSGAAQYVVKQKGCDVDVTGATAHALEEGVERQLEKYVRERSEAHRRIERYRASLGKENAATLEKQADAVSFVSYVVHIDMVEHKPGSAGCSRRSRPSRSRSTRRSRRSERSSPRAIAPTRRRRRRRRASRSSGAARRCSTRPRPRAKQIDETMEERIAAAQKTYREAMDRLIATLRKNAGLPAEPRES